MLDLVLEYLGILKGVVFIFAVLVVGFCGIALIMLGVVAGVGEEYLASIGYSVAGLFIIGLTELLRKHLL